MKWCQLAAVEVRSTSRDLWPPSLGTRTAMSRKRSITASERSPISASCHSETGASKLIASDTGTPPALSCASTCAGVLARPRRLGWTVAEIGSSSAPPASARAR